MKPTGLFLTKEQVVFDGMYLAICVKGKEEPEVGPDGQPLVVITLIGGIARLSLRCYPLDLMHINPSEDRGFNGKPMSGSISAQCFEPRDAPPHVRFMPTEVFRATDVPTGRECVVFLPNGDYVKYDDVRGYAVHVIKCRNGKIVSIGDSERWQGQVYPLPEDAKLVPLVGGSCASFVGIAATHPALRATPA